MFLSRVLPCLPASEAIQLGIKTGHRTVMREILPPQLVDVLESFGTGQHNGDGGSLDSSEGTRSRLPKLSIVVCIYTFSPDFMPQSLDFIRTGDADAMQKKVRDVECQVKMSLPLCEQHGVLDLSVTNCHAAGRFKLFTLQSLSYSHHVQL
jgi:hypothetical protein